MAIDPLLSTRQSMTWPTRGVVFDALPDESSSIRQDDLFKLLGEQRGEELTKGEIKTATHHVKSLTKDGVITHTSGTGKGVRYYRTPEYYRVVLDTLPRDWPININDLWTKEFAPKSMDRRHPEDLYKSRMTVKYSLTEDRVREVLEFYTRLGILDKLDRGKNARYTRAEVQNPRRRPSKKKAPDAKRLVARCQRLWTAYYNNPTKARLLSFGKHLDTMKASKAASVKSERARGVRAYNSEFKKHGWVKRNPTKASKKNPQPASPRRAPPRSRSFKEVVEGTLYDPRTGALVVTAPKPWTANRVADWALQYFELGHSDAATEIIRQYVTLDTGRESDARKKAIERQGFSESTSGWAVANPKSRSLLRSRARKNPIETAEYYTDEIEAADKADWLVTLVPGRSPVTPLGTASYPIEVIPDELAPDGRKELMAKVESVHMLDPKSPDTQWLIRPSRTGPNGTFWQVTASPKFTRRIEYDKHFDTLQNAINELRRFNKLLIRRVSFK